MSLDLIFSASSMAAMSGWITLFASPWFPRFAERYAALAVPGLLSVAYAGLILAFWTRAEGGFDTLASVAQLFETRELLLAGWLHFLAFDLFVGAWEVRTARAEGIMFLLVVPCLVLTFLFGPIGFLIFLALRAVYAMRAQAIA